MRRECDRRDGRSPVRSSWTGCSCAPRRNSAPAGRLAALHRHLHLRGGTWLRKRGWPSARETPALDHAADACGCRWTMRPARALSPCWFAAVILLPRLTRKRALEPARHRPAERATSFHPNVIHPDIEPDSPGIPTRVPSRRPTIPASLRAAPAAIDDLQGVDQFGFPIGAAARFVPGERRQRRKYRPHMILLHQGSPNADLTPHSAAMCRARRRNPVRSARTCFVSSSALPCRRHDAPVRDAAIDVLPDLLVELRLLLHLLEHGHIRF